MDVKEFTPCVRPAGRFDQWLMLAIVQAIEPAIGIGLQDAAKMLEMGSGPLTLAIGGVTEQHGRWIGAAGGSIIAHVRPQPPGPGLAGAGSQNGDRGVIGMELVSGHHVVFQCAKQRREQRAGRPTPVGERGTIQFQPVAGIDLALAGKMAGDRSTWTPARGPGVQGRHSCARSAATEALTAPRARAV